MKELEDKEVERLITYYNSIKSIIVDGYVVLPEGYILIKSDELENCGNNLEREDNE